MYEAETDLDDEFIRRAECEECGEAKACVYPAPWMRHAEVDLPQMHC